MNTANDQTQTAHTELTQVRFTKQQKEVLRTLAYKNKTSQAVFIREFLLENIPELSKPQTQQ